MIKHELEKVGLRRDPVRGEENNEFTNTLGDSITVQVQESEGKNGTTPGNSPGWTQQGCKHAGQARPHGIRPLGPGSTTGHWESSPMDLKLRLSGLLYG
ncbi:Inositol polyphosphate1phosphatase [Caligus rogercresseyi]|uniref:Inositol polyphosphate1phosphatase n=1 Tax=Caligus rogercresseyi TaxID=217165 RepID=A0A7T8KDD2_CALRO|nr:Inositol polyphosphate1phosphatase [Caligus rogercresseyi]